LAKSLVSRVPAQGEDVEIPMLQLQLHQAQHLQLWEEKLEQQQSKSQRMRMMLLQKLPTGSDMLHYQW
jgi:hypothetical protein